MRIRFIKASETHELRHRVLRPHQTIEDCDYPHDNDPDTFHLGVFLDEQLIGIGTFMKEKNDALLGWKQYRLRGMATQADFRGQGVGRKLMDFAIDHLRSQNSDLLWCNAREVARGFYTRLGFEVVGPPFRIEGIGEHFVMARKL